MAEKRTNATLTLFPRACAHTTRESTSSTHARKVFYLDDRSVRASVTHWWPRRGLKLTESVDDGHGLVLRRETGNYDKSQESVALREPRGMLRLPDGRIIITSSSTGHESIFELGACAGRVVAPIAHWTADREKLKHPYGLALSADGDAVYVSNQNNGRVERFATKDGAYEADLADLGDKDDKVRGIASDGRGAVFIAVEGNDAIVVVNESGEAIGDFEATNPVGLAYDAANGVLLVGCNGDDHPRVEAYAVDDWVNAAGLHSPKLVATFTDRGLSHPAGLAVDYERSLLYVISQDAGTVLAFDYGVDVLAAGGSDAARAVVASGLDRPEQLLLASCDLGDLISTI